MGKIIKWSFLGMATVCGAGTVMLETHSNSVPSRDGATSCCVLVLVVINAGYMDTRQRVRHVRHVRQEPVCQMSRLSSPDVVS